MGAISTAETELHHLITALEDEGHHLADQFRTAFNTLRGEVPQLEQDAKTDAENVVTTAETQGLASAEQEAVKDAGELAAEAEHDVATAVETPTEPSA